MAKHFQMVPGFMRADDDGASIFDTTAYPVQYMGEDAEINVDLDFTFPDLLKGNAYGWQQWDGSGGNPDEGAISLVAAPDQDWGPADMSPPPDTDCIIDDVVVGTVPAATEHALYFVDLTRTNAPSQINGNTIPTAFKEGEFVPCYGGSLSIESLYPLERMIQFFLAEDDNGDGTRNVIMRVKQSVGPRTNQPFYRADNDADRDGWTWGGTYGSRRGIPLALIDASGPHTDFAGVGNRYKRGGPQQLSLTDPTDYSSTFEGTLRVIPGVSNIEPETAGSGTSGTYFLFVDSGEHYSSSGDSPHTYSSLNFGDADATRRVIVAIQADRVTGSSSNRTLTGVTIGGVTATLVVNRNSYTDATGANDLNYIAAIAVADVPSGSSGNVVLTFSDAMHSSAVFVFSGYNMISATPDATASTASDEASISLVTVAGGFAVAIAESHTNWSTRDPDGGITGIANSVMFTTANTSNPRAAARAFQATDGSTLSLTWINSATPSPSAVHPLAAASFH